MSAKIRLQLILFLCVVLLLVLKTQAVDASGDIFVIEPKQQAIEEVNLSTGAGVSSELVGDLFVTNGSIDFWITAPSGIVLVNESNIADSRFSFFAKENGSHTMHLSNSYLTQNVTVTLKYGVNMIVNLYSNINVGMDMRSEVAKVVVLPPLPEIDDPRILDNLYERYLNFLKSSEIMRTIKEGLQTPVRGMFAAVSCIIVAVGLGIVEQHQLPLKKHLKKAYINAHLFKNLE
jgi:hypothetical protein